MCKLSAVLSEAELLLLIKNMLSGSIPPGISRLPSLIKLDLSQNLLSGSIPFQVGDLSSLQGLSLGHNQLSGTLPPELGRINSLVVLNLTANQFSGPIPSALGHLKAIERLDLGSNEFDGALPLSFGNLTAIVDLLLGNNELSSGLADLLSDEGIRWYQIQKLDVSVNRFSGAIPINLSNLTSLSVLDLHGNSFVGDIPPGLTKLTQLTYLDLSNNNLTGSFPFQLCNLPDLVHLNVSGNRLVGYVPDAGSCSNVTSLPQTAQAGICSRRVIPVKCAGSLQGSLLSRGAILGITLGTVTALLCLLFVLVRWKLMKQDSMLKIAETTKLMNNGSIDSASCLVPFTKSKEPLSINVAMFAQPLIRLTLADILLATDNFSKTNIIGDGGFGTVYKATLPDGRCVAIKKLGFGSSQQGNREFLAEMETLGKVRHRNLVPLLGYCSFGEEKLLVYEHMENGSLDLWLRNRADAIEVLDWPKRMKIALGAARGLAFLHHGFTPHVIHRDVKASNILLDGDFEPRVADFGLARLISASDTHVTTRIAGTFGYIPPEYGQSWRATKRGDVFSFGVVLLELLTGKEPTGSEYKEPDSGNLVDWVKSMMVMGSVQKQQQQQQLMATQQQDDKGDYQQQLQRQVMGVQQQQEELVLDPFLASHSFWKPQMLQVLRIAMSCTSEDPMKRPSMLDVVSHLKDLISSSD